MILLSEKDLFDENTVRGELEKVQVEQNGADPLQIYHQCMQALLHVL